MRRQFEAEADYVGLYIMARAGRGINDSPRFWRRMGGAVAALNIPCDEPPDSPERFVGLTSSVREIDGKRRRGATLLPNLK